jgi:2-amino-4-hydroxy-6-hydroxymethyldihydropteridine diphosphokinase
MAEGETACPMESESSWPPTGDALDVVIGLGANLGTPELSLRTAVLELASWGHAVAISKLYRSAPVGGPPQPEFRNAALRLRFGGNAHTLLERLLRVERDAGRVRRERWGPRTLDLDILWVDGLVLTQPELVVPHPRLREREFALRPLLDVAPEASDPRDGMPYSRVLAELGPTRIVALPGAWVDLQAAPRVPGMDTPGAGW